MTIKLNVKDRITIYGIYLFYMLVFISGITILFIPTESPFILLALGIASGTSIFTSWEYFLKTRKLYKSILQDRNNGLR